MAEAKAPTILLVEDDLLFQRTYYTHLREEGYQVRLASDGEQALQEIEASPPDLVLLDLLLPRLSGYDVLARIRADSRFAELPVIVLTNKGEREDIARAMELGASDYFVKFTARPREVLWKARQVIAKRAGRAATLRVALREKELDAELVAEASGKPHDLRCPQCGGRIVLELLPRSEVPGAFEARLVCPKCG
jgi:DNA-binding response OmpR family regulator